MSALAMWTDVDTCPHRPLTNIGHIYIKLTLFDPRVCVAESSETDPMWTPSTFVHIGEGTPMTDLERRQALAEDTPVLTWQGWRTYGNDGKAYLVDGAA